MVLIKTVLNKHPLGSRQGRVNESGMTIKLYQVPLLEERMIELKRVTGCRWAKDALTIAVDAILNGKTA